MEISGNTVHHEPWTRARSLVKKPPSRSKTSSPLLLVASGRGRYHPPPHHHCHPTSRCAQVAECAGQRHEVWPVGLLHCHPQFASTYELLLQAPVVWVCTDSGEALARVAEFFGMGALLPLPPTATPCANLHLWRRCLTSRPNGCMTRLSFTRRSVSP
jgi:hypothetical protein